MKYCDNCGNELNKNANFCSNCGKNFSLQNQVTNGNSGSVIACAIVGLLFPIIGAILYYVLKNTDEKAAKTANVCAWISFGLRVLLFLLYGVSIFSLL